MLFRSESVKPLRNAILGSRIFELRTQWRKWVLLQPDIVYAVSDTILEEMTAFDVRQLIKMEDEVSQTKVRKALADSCKFYVCVIKQAPMCLGRPSKMKA